MTLPGQFKEENTENIFIYHYVEELVSNYGKYLKAIFHDEIITVSEFPFLVRVRFNDKTTQKDLVDLFNVSEGYTAKLLRKFEDNGLIVRKENPSNRRKKLVRLTEKGIEKTDELIEIISNWENQQTSKLTKDETALLKELLFKLVS